MSAAKEMSHFVVSEGSEALLWFAIHMSQIWMSHNFAAVKPKTLELPNLTYFIMFCIVVAWEFL